MCTERTPRRLASALARRTAGFTLVELIAALLIVSIAVAAVAAVIASTVRGSADPVIQTQAIYVAEAYLEEALLKAYDNPDGVVGPCGANRNLWDSVADYACLSAAAVPSDQNGTAAADLADYRVSMSVDAPATVGGAAARRLEVRVTHVDGSVDLSLAAYRAQY